MIKILKGNLLDVKHGIIGHQTNCMGKMGSGVAKQVKEKHPKAFVAYSDLVNEYMLGGDSRKFLLGTSQFVMVDKGLYVANLFGQHTYGYDGKKYTSEESLFKCFTELRYFAENEGLPVYLPYNIGCALGGGDWETVENLLLTAFEGYEVTLYKL